MTSPEIKFLYVRDTACPDHVVTIARRLVGDRVEMTFCSNKVVRADVAYRKDRYEPRWIVMDRFNKQKARMITEARFKRPELVMSMPYEKGRVIINALEFFSERGFEGDKNKTCADLIPLSVQRVVKNALLHSRRERNRKMRDQWLTERSAVNVTETTEAIKAD